MAAPAVAVPASGEKKGLRSISAQSQLSRGDAVRTDLDEGAADRDAGIDLAGDGAGGDAHRGLARRGTPAAAIVAQPVFGL